jgi:NADPH-dependent glutamate synthase beta subunit-like oxidoreductase
MPEEFAEFMASLEEDEAFAEAAQCNDCDPEYND